MPERTKRQGTKNLEGWEGGERERRRRNGRKEERKKEWRKRNLIYKVFRKLSWLISSLSLSRAFFAKFVIA